MTAAAPALMTVAEYEQLPNDDGPFSFELHHGELVQVAKPKLEHYVIQQDAEQALRARMKSGRLGIEFVYCPVREFELRVADVAYISAPRWAAAPKRNYFIGAPDLVIEVVSPSNTIAGMEALQALCLENGAIEFWVISPVSMTVWVMRNDGTAAFYRAGQHIPLDVIGGGSLAVDEIFV